MNLAYQVNTSLVLENVSDREAAFLHAAVEALHGRYQYDLSRTALLEAADRIMAAIMAAITGLRDGHICLDRFDLPYLRLALDQFAEEAQDPAKATLAQELLGLLGGLGDDDKRLG